MRTSTRSAGEASVRATETSVLWEDAAVRKTKRRYCSSLFNQLWCVKHIVYCCGERGRVVKALDSRSRDLGFDSCSAGYV